VNGGRISGATTTNLTISTVQTNDSGDYSVIVTNIVGSVTNSPAAVLTVLSSPVILVQPTNQSVAVGATATFVVTAIGVAPLSYQWLKNGAPLANYGEYSGVITSQLTITGAQTNNSDIYAVVITNSLGSVTSSNAVLTVTNVPPAITVQPTNQTVEVGATATLAVTATGTEPLSYQWWLNETNLLVDGGQIEGATSNVLTISNVQLTNNGNYTVIVTNVAGSVTSSNAVLTVTNVPPAIVVQPTNQTVGVGSTVILAVTATGTEPLSYQWQVDGTNLLVDGGQIEGAISNVLTISNVQLTNNGNYTVIVTNVAGSVISSNAVLTVALPLNFGSIIASGDSGGGFILSGTGGVTNGTYYVLTSSNLLLPLTNWTSIATDQFDSAGNFIFTNAAQTNAPQLFYLLQLP
jgi:hypothetical protein